jgi:DNA end-binding protein Ku
MIQIAQKIIEQKEGPFDPEQFNDRYEDALRALIKEKQKGKGRKVSAPAEPEDTNVVDLMEALRSSLGKAPAKKPAAKAPARRKAS